MIKMKIFDLIMYSLIMSYLLILMVTAAIEGYAFVVIITGASAGIFCYIVVDTIIGLVKEIKKEKIKL